VEITVRKIGKCKILDCSGPITIGPAAQALRKAVREAVQDGTSKIVLNLGDVPYTEDAGTAELISSFVYVKNQGGSLLLLNVAPKVRKWLVISKLATIFDIYDDEQKALEGCE